MVGGLPCPLDAAVETPMNESLHQHEKAYLEALSTNRLEDAKASLLSGIRVAKQVDARLVIAGFTQRLGSILWKQGDHNGAMACYEIAETLDQGSLLAMLDYAKFLLSEVGDSSAAEAKCNDIIGQATSNPFPSTDHDFSSDEYIAAARRVLESARKN